VLEHRKVGMCKSRLVKNIVNLFLTVIDNQPKNASGGVFT
jgi:hypothetical protein